MRNLLLPACILVGLAAPATLATTAMAQTIYLPIQYQYDATGQGNYFYYGGSDPLVFRAATAASVDPRFGRSSGVAFHATGSPNGSHRIVASDGPQVYSDALPTMNAARFGYSINDARNAAYAAVPTYFRMADVRASAVTLADGSRVVPPTAPTREFAAASAAAAKAREPLTKGVIMIIPYKKPAAPANPKA